MSNTSETAGIAAAISVSELNRRARELLEAGIARLWVEGEVSNVVRPASGHVYFTLKDDAAQLRCAWFRQRQRGPALQLQNGDNMLIFGQISIYEMRGDYQLIVERVEAAGEGELRRRFEALKKSLQREGLFDDARKRPLPRLPQRIGIVTSPSGAAVRDILSVLKRRFSLVPVIVYPAAVQGEAAAGELVAALQSAARRGECDVLIIGRGGGSLEDLWPFNEERVVRAIAASPIPVISAVGHEVDFTIADFVADLRAPTPSGAAELVVPDQLDWQRSLAGLQSRIATLGQRHLEARAQQLDWLGRRLAQASPTATLSRQSAQLRNLQQIMLAAMRHALTRRGVRVERLRAGLLQQSPALRVNGKILQLAALRHRLHTAGRQLLESRKSRLAYASRSLHAVSPLATLDRGYAIVTESVSGRVLSSVAGLGAGDRISAKLADGSFDAAIERIRGDET